MKQKKGADIINLENKEYLMKKIIQQIMLQTERERIRYEAGTSC
jgi:hypothetical protein